LTPQEERYLAELQARDYDRIRQASKRPSRSLQEAQDRLAVAKRRLARAKAVMDKGMSSEIANWKSPGYARCEDVFQRGGDAELRAEAEKGDVHCQYFLGLRIASQATTDAESVRGWSMAFEAGEKGSPEGEYALGVAYLTGNNGKPQNISESMQWFRRAAGHGHPDAVVALTFAQQIAPR